MATIHVARDGANIGTFSSEEVREGLRTGRFLPTDMAWQEGMPDWRPLAQVVPEKPAAAASASGATETSAVSVSAAGSGAAGISGSGLPWEHRQELGLVKAFFDTVIMLLTKPAEAFGMMKTEGGLMDPLFFALIGGCAGMLVAFLFQLVFQSMGFMINRNSGIMGMGMGIWIFFGLIAMPVMFVCWLFIWSGILHLCLMMLGGAKKPFETTFRVVCFSSGSAYLFAIVPVCGRVVAPIYNIVLQCMGVARAHETDTGKAVMAVLLPVIVCCGGVLLLAFLFGAGVLSQLSHH
jgi:hypothetical protein